MRWPTVMTFTLADGTSVRVRIGADPGDPRLVITDLLPHLGMEQNKKPLGEAVPGETLNLLVGSRPIGDMNFPPPAEAQYTFSSRPGMALSTMSRMLASVGIPAMLTCSSLGPMQVCMMGSLR